MKNLNAILTPTLDLIISFSKVKGARFFAINGYVKGEAGKRKCIQPETANHVVNLGVSYVGAQIKDIETLRALDVRSLDFKGIDIETAEIARLELLSSLLKLSTKFEVEGFEYTAKQLEAELSELVTSHFPTNEVERAKLLKVLSKTSTYRRSNTQKELYKQICNGVKIYVGDEKELKGSMKIHAFAVEGRKVVTTKGIWLGTNSSDKTIAKNIIKKGLKATKYRTFTISQIEGNVKVNGEELVFEKA